MTTNEEKKPTVNMFVLLNDQIIPVWKKIRRWIYIPFILLVVFFVLGFSLEKKKPSYFNSTITYILEDEIVNEGSKAAGGSGQLLAALAGQSPSGNKTIMVDLSLSNKLVEQTLLRTVEINKKKVLLVNYYIDKFGYQGSFSTAEPYTADFKLGQDEKLDYWLRVFSSSIKLSLKSKVMESGLITMNLTSTDELFIKLFLDNHFKTISDFYIQKKMEKSLNLAAFAKKRRDSLLMVLQGKSYAAANISDNLFGSVMKRARVDEAQATRDIGIASTLYTESVIAYNSATIDLERKKPFISVVDDIRLPLDSSSPKPMVKGILFGVGGLILGFVLLVGIVLGKDFLQKQKNEFILSHGNKQ